MIFHGPLSLRIPKNQVVSKKSKSVLQQAYFEFLFAEGGGADCNKHILFFFQGGAECMALTARMISRSNLK